MDTKRLYIQRHQQGFTIIELMVAATTFAVILLMVAGTIVRFTNQFQKGVVESSTQNVARSVTEAIVEAIQAGDAVKKTAYGYCIGTTAYIADQMKTQLGSTEGSYALKERNGTGSSCSDLLDTVAKPPHPSGPAYAPIGRELLGEGMRLSKFEIAPISGTNLQKVSVTVAYGDDDLLCSPSIDNCANQTVLTALQFKNATDLRCKAQKGSHFCAVRDLSVTVRPWL